MNSSHITAPQSAQRRGQRRTQRGLTLIECVVTLAIIVITLGAAIPTFKVAAFTSLSEGGNRGAERDDDDGQGDHTFDQCQATLGATLAATLGALGGGDVAAVHGRLLGGDRMKITVGKYRRRRVPKRCASGTALWRAPAPSPMHPPAGGHCLRCRG